MEFKDYYKILGVQRSATDDEIKKAYRKGARKYHPDVSKAADAHERMAEINEAHQVLSDPERRAAYDSLGSAPPGAGAHEFRPPPNWDAGFEFSDADAGAADAGYSDFFEQLFGRAARGQGRARGGFDGFAEAPAGPQRGADHHAKIELDLLDAYHGAQRAIRLRSAHLDAQGRIVNDEHELHVSIPKGVREGQHIRLAGRGSPGHAGGAAGDLLLEVLFRPDPRWRAEGRDVHQRLALAPWEAMLGGSVQVSTPGGEAQVNVPAGSSPGRKLRLKGRGIPGSGTQPAGDLYLDIDVVLPAADGDAARAAYGQMAKAFPNFNARSGRAGV